MMIFAPNSLVRQKEGAHGEEEEETGGRRRVGSIESVRGEWLKRVWRVVCCMIVKRECGTKKI